ncbi:hypothetical protein GWI33_018638 [Rhynchophorus ferrugineus]|uniref:Uncharacterized protein n=1 Tax=Rhynchophorus ferrugineus TaxID=354439 RepID=A0A834HXE5_RHYFE|nr:hypothetical protein GWI33_018638 [Rhynchophorus ferrugineus]
MGAVLKRQSVRLQEAHLVRVRAGWPSGSGCGGDKDARWISADLERDDGMPAGRAIERNRKCYRANKSYSEALLKAHHDGPQPPPSGSTTSAGDREREREVRRCVTGPHNNQT